MAKGPTTDKEIDILIKYIFRENDKNRDNMLEPSEWHVPPSFQQEQMKRGQGMKETSKGKGSNDKEKTKEENGESEGNDKRKRKEQNTKNSHSTGNEKDELWF